jgi:hypothetical protein
MVGPMMLLWQALYQAHTRRANAAAAMSSPVDVTDNEQ